MSRDNKKNLLGGTLVIMAVTLMAKLASFIAEALLASTLGASYQGDAYHMVASIQQVIYPMLSVGVWKVFLPIYKEKIAHNKLSHADAFANITVLIFTGVAAVVVLALVLAADWIVSIVAPGFSGDTRDLCILLVKISSPMYLFIMVAAIYAAMLQCHGRFFGSQIRQVVSHIPTIFAALFFYQRYGVNTFAYALVIAAILRMVVQFPFINWKYSIKITKAESYKPDISLMFKRLPSAFLSEGVTQINVMVDKVMASTLPVGAVSCLNYGHRLMTVFSGLICSAVNTSMYPEMVECITLNKKDKLRKVLERIIRIYTIIILPVSVGCVLFSTDIVNIVYVRGAFGSESAATTSSIFMCYTVGLFFMAVNSIIDYLFYASGDTKTPFMINAMNMIVNVTLNLILVKAIGINGLAIATSLSALVMFGVRTVFTRKIITIQWMNILNIGIKILLLSLLSFGVPKLIAIHFSFSSLQTIAAAFIVGGAAFACGLWVMKPEEISIIVETVSKKLKRGNKA